MPYKIWADGLTDIGLRQNNEDVWFVLPTENLFVIADGMGGHQAGEVASQETVNTLCSLFQASIAENSHDSLEEAETILVNLLQQVNDKIYKMGRANGKLKGMGTTVCCVWIVPGGVVYAHVGDSRIYRFRHNKIEQLTQDHSLLQELIEMGQINEDQAERFVYKNIITKAIGTEPIVQPTVHTDYLIHNDLFLMCTDGLSDMISAEEIESIMIEEEKENIVKRLVRLAKNRGGHDNITALLIQVQETHYEEDLS